jgi:hypothetical protein
MEKLDNISEFEEKIIIEKWPKSKSNDIVINPLTNRRIIKNGSVYKKIDNKYEELYIKVKNLKIENNDGHNIFKKDEIFIYESLNLDINIKYIINKIKIVNIDNLSIILNYNNNFSSTKFNFDINQEKYNYNIIKINKLIIGIEDTEIEEVFPKNEETKYISFIQYPNYVNITNKTLNDIKNIFCLLCVEKIKIEEHDEQEIALYLLTLQYWNYLLESYKKYGWIDNLLAIVKVDNECYIYNIKISKIYMEEFINKCKSFKYDFKEIVIEKCKLDINKQLELIKYLGFGVFDIFNRI